MKRLILLTLLASTSVGFCSSELFGSQDEEDAMMAAALAESLEMAQQQPAARTTQLPQIQLINGPLVSLSGEGVRYVRESILNPISMVFAANGALKTNFRSVEDQVKALRDTQELLTAQLVFLKNPAARHPKIPQYDIDGLQIVYRYVRGIMDTIDMQLRIPAGRADMGYGERRAMPPRDERPFREEGLSSAEQARIAELERIREQEEEEFQKAINASLRESKAPAPLPSTRSAASTASTPKVQTPATAVPRGATTPTVIPTTRATAPTARAVPITAAQVGGYMEQYQAIERTYYELGESPTSAQLQGLQRALDKLRYEIDANNADMFLTPTGVLLSLNTVQVNINRLEDMIREHSAPITYESDKAKKALSDLGIKMKEVDQMLKPHVQYFMKNDLQRDQEAAGNWITDVKQRDRILDAHQAARDAAAGAIKDLRREKQKLQVFKLDKLDVTTRNEVTTAVQSIDQKIAFLLR